MADHCNRKVMLCTEHDRWFLYEEGRPEYKQQPWEWTLDFGLIDIQIRDRYVGCEEKEVITENGLIVANLYPQKSSPQKFFIFGTDRPLSDIRLYIKATEDDRKESCVAEGHAGWPWETKHETNTTPYTLSFNLLISKSRFANLVKLVRDKAIDAAWLSVGKVEGFYSLWMLTGLLGMDIKNLMVLPQDKAYPVEIPDNCAIEPLRLGKVGNFELTFYSELTPINSSEPTIDCAAGDEEKKSENEVQRVAYSDPATLRLLKSLWLAAWIAIVLLVLILIYKR